MSLPFRCVNLPFELNGNMVFYAGALYETPDKKFFVADSSMTQLERFLGEPTPSAVLDIVSRHWQNDDQFKGQVVRYATKEEGEQFTRQFDDRTEKLVVGGVYNHGCSEARGLPPARYQYSYFRCDFRLLLVIENQESQSIPKRLYDPAAPVECV